MTHFHRCSTLDDAVTGATLHLFSQINLEFPDKFRSLLSGLLGDAEMPLGVSIQQQAKTGPSIPSGSILQEPVHILIETRVRAKVDTGKLTASCESFAKNRTGNHLMLLTDNKVDSRVLDVVRSVAKKTGVAFANVTFEELCNALRGLAKECESPLFRVVKDYADYCAETGLLPDRRNWLRIVPCGSALPLNEKWNIYFQPTNRGCSGHDYLGLYAQKAVRLVGRVQATYDNRDAGNQMELSLARGEDRPLFRQRIEGIVNETRETLGWDIQCGYRFFCADKLIPTEYRKTSPGGIHGTRFFDITDLSIQTNSNDQRLAELLREKTWE